MKRRTFFKNSLVAGAATFAGLSLPLGREAEAKASPFNMKFSPDFGLFADVAGKLPKDQTMDFTHGNAPFCKDVHWKNKTRSVTCSKNWGWISGSL